MTIRFAVIGLNHNHIYGQVKCLVDASAEFVSYYAPEADLIAEFAAHYPQVKLAHSAEEILEDETIQIVASAGIPSDRAPLGVRVMQHGKDYMVDKPGFTTLEQLAEVRRVQQETGRIYSVYFSERFSNAATVKAGELVHAGAIGRVIQTLGIGPHRMFGHVQRPDWFFKRDRFGGILNDIGSHQVDQFFYFTGSTDAEIVSSQVGNMNHPTYPEVEDFGDMTLTSDRATGYIRVDWFTPDGLGTWGDGRLFLMGTDGYIELRKYRDIGGRAGENHLFMVDNKGIQYIDCNDVPLTFGPLFLDDVINRTETAMTQEHCFRVSEIAMQAQAQARRLQSKH
ncbi:MAG: Gfo/Idh/MocA family oxidoreductase [Burkholderiales bacterium]|nr:Gfo/Idh/MocA family oxidoreductase [Anaerolineae bacterium]